MLGELPKDGAERIRAYSQATHAAILTDLMSLLQTLNNKSRQGYYVPKRPTSTFEDSIGCPALDNGK